MLTLLPVECAHVCIASIIVLGSNCNHRPSARRRTTSFYFFLVSVTSKDLWLFGKTKTCLFSPQRGRLQYVFHILIRVMSRVFVISAAS
ncbi:hypothetical protein HOY82DRAFT_563718 [Tuber indicum]|nr:hypothetical protein HOY82DRAFT_563718 [Tuber indicum]